MAPETTDVEIGDVVVGQADGVVPLEVLERQLTSHAAHLAAAEARWLGWLGEYCVREGWLEWGCSSAVQWLSWQCGMSPSTAREKVRVGLALRDLPVIMHRFAKGRLSYSKVRALTRIATPQSDFDLAELGVAATGSQLDRIVRARKNAIEANRGAKDAWRERKLRTRSVGDELTEIRILVPNDQADQALDAIAAEMSIAIDDAGGDQQGSNRKQVIESRGGFGAMRADAAMALLTGTARTTEVLPAEVQVVVDAETHDHHQETASVVPDTDTPAGASVPLSFTSRGHGVAPVVGQRLCCDPRISVLIEAARGTVLGSGRRTRLISPKLRRALDRRDRGRCQFPGCAGHRRLHAHHIVHWINGGPTELDNLILVCHFHHHVVHEGGWNIDPNDRSFLKPDGSIADPIPTATRQGCADETTSAATFSTLAPLAEAENTPYDLGLVLESLAWDHDTHALPHLDSDRHHMS